MTATSRRTITVRVLLFASYADRLGREELAVQLEAPATVADVIASLRRGQAEAEALPERPLTALNRVHVPGSSVVHDGDELALLPPMAGG